MLDAYVSSDDNPVRHWPWLIPKLIEHTSCLEDASLGPAPRLQSTVMIAAVETTTRASARSVPSGVDIAALQVDAIAKVLGPEALQHTNSPILRASYGFPILARQAGTCEIARVIWLESVLDTTIYLYSGANLLEEVDVAGNVLARYTSTRNTDEPLAELRSNTSSYYEQDGLGSVTSLSSGAGGLANTYSYDSFGKLTASSGTLINPFQYAGREFDSETGIYYNRARYYDSNAGRFVSEDPITFDGGIDFYSYAANDPIRWTDPLGLCPKSCGIKSLSGYEPNGVQPVGTTFHWHVEFLNDSTHDPSCCEVRQFVSWNRPPRPGRSSPYPMPPDYQPGQWYEDRDSNGYRYGRRSGPYHNPNWDANDYYSGDSYYGADTPQGYIGPGFSETFRLQIVDVCNGDQVIADVRRRITVQW